MNPPKQITLSVDDFRNGEFGPEHWAKKLVESFNQLSLQTTQVLNELIQAQDGSARAIADASGAGNTKTISLKTGATVSASFPIDVPVSAIIKGVKVSMILSGEPSGAVTVVAKMLSGGRKLRISNITGLAANTSYSIRLSLEQ